MGQSNLGAENVTKTGNGCKKETSSPGKGDSGSVGAWSGTTQKEKTVYNIGP